MSATLEVQIPIKLLTPKVIAELNRRASGEGKSLSELAQEILDSQVLATARDLAREYQVDRTTIMAWFRKGWIPAKVSVGDVYRFDRKAVAAALAERSAKNSQ